MPDIVTTKDVLIMNHLIKRDAKDTFRITLGEIEEYAVRYWTEALGVDEQKLREIVKLKSGADSAGTVWEHLPKSHKCLGPSALA
jgi:hypothetical protein